MSIHPNTFLNFKYFIMTKHLKLAGMLFLSFFLCVGNYAQAERRTASTSTEQQTGTCTGVVKDAKGETLPGASVVVKNAIGSSATPIGTTTGMDGDFTINNIPVGSTLVISLDRKSTRLNSSHR